MKYKANELFRFFYNFFLHSLYSLFLLDVLKWSNKMITWSHEKQFRMQRPLTETHFGNQNKGEQHSVTWEFSAEKISTFKSEFLFSKCDWNVVEISLNTLVENHFISHVGGLLPLSFSGFFITVYLYSNSKWDCDSTIDITVYWNAAMKKHHRKQQAHNRQTKKKKKRTMRKRMLTIMGGWGLVSHCFLYAIIESSVDAFTIVSIWLTFEIETIENHHAHWLSQN